MSILGNTEQEIEESFFKVIPSETAIKITELQARIEELENWIILLNKYNCQTMLPSRDITKFYALLENVRSK
jgi:hypothetical protein